MLQNRFPGGGGGVPKTAFTRMDLPIKDSAAVDKGDRLVIDSEVKWYRHPTSFGKVNVESATSYSSYLTVAYLGDGLSVMVWSDTLPSSGTIKARLVATTGTSISMSAETIISGARAREAGQGKRFKVVRIGSSKKALLVFSDGGGLLTCVLTAEDAQTLTASSLTRVESYGHGMHVNVVPLDNARYLVSWNSGTYLISLSVGLNDEVSAGGRLSISGGQYSFHLLDGVFHRDGVDYVHYARQYYENNYYYARVGYVKVSGLTTSVSGYSESKIGFGSMGYSHDILPMFLDDGIFQVYHYYTAEQPAHTIRMYALDWYNNQYYRLTEVTKRPKGIDLSSYRWSSGNSCTFVKGDRHSVVFNGINKTNRPVEVFSVMSDGLSAFKMQFDTNFSAEISAISACHLGNDKYLLALGIPNADGIVGVITTEYTARKRIRPIDSADSRLTGVALADGVNGDVVGVMMPA